MTPVPHILHVDMDAFYASVEVHDDPSLAGQPLIVGGTGRRGVVASCSYEARAYGIRSAMPAARARQLCPHAVFLPGRYDRYAEASRQLHDIFERFTPIVEPIALDEAFLDVGGTIRLFGSAPLIGAKIRGLVTAELGLSCSVGVAAVKFLAKLASEAAKPSAALGGAQPGRGVFVIEPGEELSFLHPLPIEALWGVGPATAARLRRLGVATVGELAALPPAAVEVAVGRAVGRHLYALAQGRDERPVQPNRTVKSIGHEETYATDRYLVDELHREVVRMADAVSSRLRVAGVAGRTVTLKLRYGDFSTITRARSFAAPVDTGLEIAAAASSLLDAVDLTGGIRLLGVTMSNLSPSVEVVPALQQLVLDLDGPIPAIAGSTQSSPGPRGLLVDQDQRRSRWAAATGALDAVRGRFGAAAAGPAVLLDNGGLRVKRQGDTQWGPASRSGPTASVDEAAADTSPE